MVKRKIINLLVLSSLYLPSSDLDDEHSVPDVVIATNFISFLLGTHATHVPKVSQCPLKCCVVLLLLLLLVLLIWPILLLWDWPCKTIV